MNPIKHKLLKVLMESEIPDTTVTTTFYQTFTTLEL